MANTNSLEEAQGQVAEAENRLHELNRMIEERAMLGHNDDDIRIMIVDAEVLLAVRVRNLERLEGEDT